MRRLRPMYKFFGIILDIHKLLKINKMIDHLTLRTPKLKNSTNTILFILFYCLYINLPAQCPANYTCNATTGVITFQFDAGNASNDRNVACDFVRKLGGTGTDPCSGGFFSLMVKDNKLRYLIDQRLGIVKDKKFVLEDQIIKNIDKAIELYKE